MHNISNPPAPTSTCLPALPTSSCSNMCTSLTSPSSSPTPPPQPAIPPPAAQPSASSPANTTAATAATSSAQATPPTSSPSTKTPNSTPTASPAKPARPAHGSTACGALYAGGGRVLSATSSGMTAQREAGIIQTHYQIRSLISTTEAAVRAC